MKNTRQVSWLWGLALFWVGIVVPIASPAATVSDAGTAVAVTNWFSQGFGDEGFIFFTGKPPSANSISGNMSTPGSGADIEYTDLAEQYAGDNLNFTIENGSGTGTDLNTGFWLDAGGSTSNPESLISFAMNDTPTALRVGVLVGAGERSGTDYPTLLVLSDGVSAYTQTVSQVGVPQPDWYFFDVSGITPSAVLTLSASTGSNSSGQKQGPINGVVFRQIPDSSGPTLASESPADGQTLVPTTGELVLTFNELLTNGTGTIALRRTSNSEAVAEYETSALSITGAQVTVAYAGLELFADYHVTISPGAFLDTDGNPSAGVTDKTTWNFSTGGIATNVTDWVTRGYGDFAYIFFDANTAAVSANVSTNGTAIEYIDLAENQDNAAGGSIPIQNEAGTATDLAVGRWYDSRLTSGVFYDLVSFAMQDCPSRLRVGVLVGAGGGNDPQAPNAIRLTDGASYTNTAFGISSSALNRPDWYFFDVEGISDTTELTVLATVGSAGFLWNPINGVVFAPIPEPPLPPGGTVLLVR